MLLEDVFLIATKPPAFTVVTAGLKPLSEYTMVAATFSPVPDVDCPLVLLCEFVALGDAECPRATSSTPPPITNSAISATPTFPPVVIAIVPSPVYTFIITEIKKTFRPQTKSLPTPTYADIRLADVQCAERKRYRRLRRTQSDTCLP